ncbi:hypothetical protein RS030_156 [Cryptosporidium xiaoi]|uniref:Uncharacterized protein n=1 Tax=Cryptosporidium xiaoi TaxID=659607 RepID=A0AAV9XYV1_9CRYT
MNNKIIINKISGEDYDELCVNALNSVSRPPEVDEPFLGVFKSKPKLKIISREKDHLRNKERINESSEAKWNNLMEYKNESMKDNKISNLSDNARKSENVSVMDEYILKNDIKEDYLINKNLRRIKSENGEEYRKDIINKNSKTNMSKTINNDSLNKASSETRKRKITNPTNEARDEFLSVITPISPYVISPKNNINSYYKNKINNNNNNNKELTERNIDILKSLIEIKDKELSNLNTNYSYEKSEYKLEIIHLKERIREYEDSYLTLKKDLVLKDEIIENLNDNINKLKSEHISTKESLEIMLEAEKNANLNLKQELKEKIALLNSFGCSGLSILSEEGIIIEQKNYKYKYFDAVSKLQRLETELVLLKKSTKQGNNIIAGSLPPIYFGEMNLVRTNKDFIDLGLSLKEVNVNITGMTCDGSVENNEEVFQLVTENRILFQDNIKLREELELQRNKNIVANIRNLTQKPITISSCIGTRLSLSEIELLENNSRLYEERKRMNNYFAIDNKNVCININPRDINHNMNISKLNCINISSVYDNYCSNLISKGTQILTGKECEYNNSDEMNKSPELIKELTVIVEVNGNLNNNCNENELKDDIHLNYYKLAFENYDLIQKMKPNKNNIKNDSYVSEYITDVNQRNNESLNNYMYYESINNKLINSKQIQEIKRIIFELNYKLKEIKNVVLKCLIVPPNLMDIITNMIYNSNINTNNTQIENIIYKDNLLYNISILISRVYKSYIDYVNKRTESFISQKKEYDENLSRFEFQIHKITQEKIDLLNEIKKLRDNIEIKESKVKAFIQNKNEDNIGTISDEMNIDKSETINECYYEKDEIMSCYTFGDNSTINLDNEMELSIRSLNGITNVNSNINNKIENNEDDLFNSEIGFIEESNCSIKTKISSDSDKIDKIIKLQGRIRSFRQNNNIYKSFSNIIPVNDVNMNDILKKTDVSVKLDFDENINLKDDGLVIYNQFSSQITNKEEFKGITGTSMLLRLYRYYKQSKELEKQVMKLTKEKQKLELDYEKDAQRIQMNLLSSKLIIEARDAEVSALKDKCEYLNSRMEEDINNIKVASREEIEKVWKPRIEDLNLKCDEYKFKITSLESEMVILRQQLSFQKQIHSKKYGIKNNYNSNISDTKIKTPNKIYNCDKINKSLGLLIESSNSDLLSDCIDSDNYDHTEDQNYENIKNFNISDQGENDDNSNQHLHNLRSALTKLKTVSSSYN